MIFLSFLVILFFGAGLFWLVAYLLRNRMRRLATVLAVTGSIIGLFLLGLWIIEVSGWERKGLYKQLMYGLENEELQQFIFRQDDIQEEAVMMMSQSSMALTEVAALLQGQNQDERISARLTWMANYVTDEAHFSLWKNRRNWEQQLFFLAHTAIIIGHYQQFTQDKQYDEQWTRVATFLVNGISRSQYKHLASRSGDSALRPADNAAALYALKLYDDAHGTIFLTKAGEDWSQYIRRELQFEDTKLPCAGFSATNRCRLPAVGGSLAVLNSYTAAAELPISTDFWREFRYYYKETFVNVFGWIDQMPRGEELPEFCDFSVQPLTCGLHESVFAQYTAAKRKDWVTYFQLNNSLLLEDLFYPPNGLWNKRPQEQVTGLLHLATRLAAVSRP